MDFYLELTFYSQQQSFNLCHTNFLVKFLQPNNESKNANVENQQPPPPPLKPLPPKPSATPSSNAAVYDTSAPKYQRVAHTQKRSAAPQQNIPDAVPVQPPKRKVVIPKEDATPTKKLISKLVNWSWDADNNGLAPVNYMRRCEGFNYRNTEHWKACVFSTTLILILNASIKRIVLPEYETLCANQHIT